MEASSERHRLARRDLRARRDRWTAAAGERLGARDAARFVARVERWYTDAHDSLASLYGATHDVAALLDALLARVLDAAASRPEPLRQLDDTRDIDPEWLLAEGRIGYVCYVDRFAGGLAAIADHLDHLAELGVTYLHLVPLLAPRPGPNDGGYAVVDHRAVDPALGTMSDLRNLASIVRGRGIALCIDLVVNHTAREHDWARRAIAGEQRYRDYYLLFDDRELPDAYERTLPEVFPDRARPTCSCRPSVPWYGSPRRPWRSRPRRLRPPATWSSTWGPTTSSAASATWRTTTS